MTEEDASRAMISAVMRAWYQTPAGREARRKIGEKTRARGLHSAETKARMSEGMKKAWERRKAAATAEEPE